MNQKKLEKPGRQNTIPSTTRDNAISVNKVQLVRVRQIATSKKEEDSYEDS